MTWSATRATAALDLADRGRERDEPMQEDLVKRKREKYSSPRDEMGQDRLPGISI